MIPIIRAIKVDSKEKRIYEISLPLSLDGIYDAIECNLFDVLRLPDMDVLIDDEGGGHLAGFHISGVPVWGNGLVVGFDAEVGNHTDTPHTITYVAARVQFFIG